MPPVRAPEIGGLEGIWLNTEAPLTLAGLRGKLVILDFWTFCCINCMHVLPTLRRIEQAFPEEVAVIGVHSPKFAAERDPAKVAAAVARYGIDHAVVHDPDFRIWRQYAVRAWPTLVLVSPDGYVLGQHSGEPDADLLLRLVGEMLGHYRREGVLTPRPLDLSPAAQASGRLRFPGKIRPLVLDGCKAWAVADAGHHQVAVLDDDGRELRRFGSGQAGFADGEGTAACFDGPQGVAADGSSIHVADTGNHALRRIDLASGRVTTLAGTGRRGGVLGEQAPGRETALASPWDVEVRGPLLLFANAGSHQLGQFDLASGRVARLAGAGPEGLRDGPAPDAHLAQPSGLALSPDGGTLWFADSETSSARALDLASGSVTTLVGTGLFDFGHVNGPFADAQLQHCLGIACWDGRLLVADSYNDAVRILDPATRMAEDFDAGAFTCTDPSCLPLIEPAGIRADGPDRVLVSDTNNHRILEYRPSKRTYRTWAG